MKKPKPLVFDETVWADDVVNSKSDYAHAMKIAKTYFDQVGITIGPTEAMLISNVADALTTARGGTPVVPRLIR